MLLLFVYLFFLLSSFFFQIFDLIIDLLYHFFCGFQVTVFFIHASQFVFFLACFIMCRRIVAELRKRLDPILATLEGLRRYL